MLTSALVALGQGGPPLLTDDPGTPGNHNWEINAAYTVENRAKESEDEAPILDINYGVGERLQLKLELPWIAQYENTESHSGIGNSLLGVKWRFLDDPKHELQISTYPQVEINNPGRSVQRDLVERGPGFLLPVEITKKAGPIELNVESGYWFQRTATRRWMAGLAAGHEINHRLELLTEVYSIGNGSGRDYTWDFGGRLGLGGPVTLLLMSGRSFSSAASGQPTLIGYFGLQFQLPKRSGQ